MRDEVLYSNKLYNMMSTYVIDGKCIKNRYGALSIGKKEIKRRMENFENIAIQNDDKIVMYCDNNLFPLVKDTIENDSFISRAHKNNKVVLISG
jgi:hypothetical protein